MFIKVIFTLTLTLLCYRQVLADTRIPDAIKVSDEYKLQLTAHAKGDQIFLCMLEAGAYQWKWQAPEATLYDPADKSIVGSHGFGPNWVYRDGSSVKAKVIGKADSPDKDAALWLLLESTEHKGKGQFAQVGFIQCLHTWGGMPPSSVCDANHLGSEKRIPYSADYTFYSI